MNKKAKKTIFYTILILIIIMFVIECISIVINGNTRRECIKKYNNKINIIEKCYN